MQLYLHTLGSSIACATQTKAVTLELGDTREPSPAAQKAKVSRLLDEAMASLDAVIRSKKLPSTDIPAATLGRRLIERGETYDAVNRTYTPGPGFAAYLAALVTDEVATAQIQATLMKADREGC
ncbi:hypothetical protein AOT83_10955 [Mycobacteroides sp. H001]|uniref:hypothetical protein n=1 Tax=Mycobacteroides TaxID=670516 RepID=UPI000715142D|nr:MULTISPECIES: hypothetical protein [Mycobacteroides]KRQ29949.1 hypothetical protein AOT86_04455 [Mycobacteroides sp. H072]KRQ38884.1 hypothetical protein AOT84_06895 [Mycobacteroides sp. H002]KRQ49208.1 hypothetical protein AOT85_16170 [Mycobacteroides sp. H054]KRQ70334.1 hypothetical protein AOT83_10955 [Mycobacteroides sp. H001]OHU33316.1 hypothetical protein BKG79_22170 [Mycobacteroides chelonae]